MFCTVYVVQKVVRVGRVKINTPDECEQPSPTLSIFPVSCHSLTWACEAHWDCLAKGLGSGVAGGLPQQSGAITRVGSTPAQTQS